MSDNLSTIPGSVAALAMQHGIKILEREDDFLATSDKTPGAEFEAGTARSAVFKCMEAMGMDPNEIDQASSEPMAGTQSAGGSMPDDHPALKKAMQSEPEPKAARKPRPSELAAKAAKAAAPHPAGGKPGKPSTAEAMATAAEASQPAPIANLAAERAKREAAAAPEAKPEAAADQPAAPAKKSGKVLTAKQPEKTTEPGFVAAKEEAAKGKIPTPAKAAAKPAATGKATPKKAATKAEAKPKAKVVDGPTNGNGRKRGTRWFVKEAVLKDPTLDAAAILTCLPKGISSTEGSVGSIRLDFMATLRAAKGLGKLKDSIAKLVPEPKATRAASTVIAEINKATLLNPKITNKEIHDHLVKTLDKKTLQHAGTQISASRAAIVESMEVMKAGNAFR